MRALFLNNEGDGIAKNLDLPEGATVQDIILQENGRDVEHYTLRRNGQPAEPDEEVQEGDRVSAAPSKIAGN